MTFKGVIPTGIPTISVASYSNFVSLSEVGVKTGRDGSAETTYIEEIRQSQNVRSAGSTAGYQVVPLNFTRTLHGERMIPHHTGFKDDF